MPGRFKHNRSSRILPIRLPSGDRSKSLNRTYPSSQGSRRTARLVRSGRLFPTQTRKIVECPFFEALGGFGHVLRRGDTHRRLDRDIFYIPCSSRFLMNPFRKGFWLKLERGVRENEHHRSAWALQALQSYATLRSQGQVLVPTRPCRMVPDSSDPASQT